MPLLNSKGLEDINDLRSKLSLIKNNLLLKNKGRFLDKNNQSLQNDDVNVSDRKKEITNEYLSHVKPSFIPSSTKKEKKIKVSRTLRVKDALIYQTKLFIKYVASLLHFGK
jgi:hypothetical protein